MKIIYAHNFYQQPGGEDQSFRAQVALLRDHGHEVFTFTRDNADLAGMNPLTAAARTVWSREAVGELDRLIARTQAELVHFHNTFLLISPAAYYAAKARGLPVVQDLRNYRLLCPAATFFRDGHVCEDCLGKALPWPGVLHACWRNSRAQTAVVAGMLATHRALGTWRGQVDRYIALTDFARQKFIQGGLPAERIAVKPNFIAAAEPPPKNGRQPFAMYAGRLTDEKGVRVLLDAWPQVAGWQLKIVGAGPLEAEVRQAAEASQAIEYLGHQAHDQVLQLMRQASLLVFPSLWYEGLPNTILESFANGLPVLTSRLGAMSAIIRDGENGMLFAPGDASDLAAKVAWAQSHPEELARIQAAALAECQTIYSPVANHARLMEIYQAAIAISQGAP